MCFTVSPKVLFFPKSLRVMVYCLLLSPGCQDVDTESVCAFLASVLHWNPFPPERAGSELWSPRGVWNDSAPCFTLLPHYVHTASLPWAQVRVHVTGILDDPLCPLCIFMPCAPACAYTYSPHYAFYTLYLELPTKVMWTSGSSHS